MKRDPEVIFDSLDAAVRSGQIRTWDEQFDAIEAHGHAHGSALTQLEKKARIMYIQYVLLTENPRRLPTRKELSS